MKKPIYILLVMCLAQLGIAAQDKPQADLIFPVTNWTNHDIQLQLFYKNTQTKRMQVKPKQTIYLEVPVQTFRLTAYYAATRRAICPMIEAEVTLPSAEKLKHDSYIFQYQDGKLSADWRSALDPMEKRRLKTLKAIEKQEKKAERKVRFERIPYHAEPRQEGPLKYREGTQLVRPQNFQK